MVYALSYLYLLTAIIFIANCVCRLRCTPAFARESFATSAYSSADAVAFIQNATTISFVSAIDSDLSAMTNSRVPASSQSRLFTTHSRVLRDDEWSSVDVDATSRNERSANLSHITGTSRKIQMYITNRHLQILPDGTVNGTNDDTNHYTILQRYPVGIGQLKIQGVATCQYLCMNACGLLYASKEFHDECVFNETLEDNNYNTYSSAKYSNKLRSMYLAINRQGQPRKVIIPNARLKSTSLGRMAAYARALTMPVSNERVQQLETHVFNVLYEQARTSSNHSNASSSVPPSFSNTHHALRHQHMNMQVCLPLDPRTTTSHNVKCRKKKKKKRRRNKAEDDDNHHDTNDNNHDVEHNTNETHRTDSISSNKAGVGHATKLDAKYSLSSDKVWRPKLSQNKVALRAFTFNGQTLTNCDSFKNANKKRKCEIARERQRHKTTNSKRIVNFHIRGVKGWQRNSKKTKHATTSIPRADELITTTLVYDDDEDDDDDDVDETTRIDSNDYEHEFLADQAFAVDADADAFYLSPPHHFVNTNDHHIQPFSDNHS